MSNAADDYNHGKHLAMQQLHY